jgi:flagellar motor switch protein FliG
MEAKPKFTQKTIIETVCSYFGLERHYLKRYRFLSKIQTASEYIVYFNDNYSSAPRRRLAKMFGVTRSAFDYWSKRMNGALEEGDKTTILHCSAIRDMLEGTKQNKTK